MVQPLAYCAVCGELAEIEFAVVPKGMTLDGQVIPTTSYQRPLCRLCIARAEEVRQKEKQSRNRK